METKLTLEEVKSKIRDNVPLRDLVMPSGINYPELLKISNSVKARVSIVKVLTGSVAESEAEPLAKVLNDEFSGPLDQALFNLADTVIAKLAITIACRECQVSELKSIADTMAILRETFYGKRSPLIQLNTQNIGVGSNARGEDKDSRFSEYLKK